MISFWRHRLFRQTWHPSFEELTAFVDGEAGSRTDRVTAHMRNCWSCRLSLEKIERAISEFMEDRSRSFGEAPTLPPGVVRVFEAKLDRLVEKAEGPSASLFAGLARECRALALAPRLAMLVACLGLLLLSFWRLNWTQPVSAKEVLDRVRQAEARRTVLVAAPVIYQKLQLRRRSKDNLETATWEIWNDIDGRRLQQSGALRSANHAPTPVVRELQDLFVRNHTDFGRPLSPDNYELWKRAIPGQTEEVVEAQLPDGRSAAILKASSKGSVSAHAVIRSELTVRTSDWHPIRQRLVIQGNSGEVDYSFGEMEFQVTARNMLPPSIFGEPRIPSKKVPDLRILALPPAPVHLDLWPAENELAPSESELTGSEVEARYALHTAKTCMGRPVEVRVGLARIEVSGLVDTEQQRTQLLSALLGIPHLFTDIRSVENSAPPPPGNDVHIPPTTGSQRPKLVTEEQLKRYFYDHKCAAGERPGECVQREIAELSRQTLDRSEAALSHVWAIRRLVQWVPFQRRDALRTSSRRLLEIMFHDHLVALRNELERSRAQLAPILPLLLTADSAGPSVKPDPEPDNDLAAAVRNLCSVAEDAANLSIATFTETDRPSIRPDFAIRSLQVKLDWLVQKLPSLDESVSADLAGAPKTLLSGEAPERK